MVDAAALPAAVAPSRVGRAARGAWRLVRRHPTMIAGLIVLGAMLLAALLVIAAIAFALVAVLGI